MSAAASFDLLGFGEALVEFNQQPADPTRYLQGFGGDTSNVVIAAARQGARTGYLSAVGDDPFGQMLLDLWRTEGVQTDGVQRLPGAPTGLYFVTHDASGHHFHYRRASSAASRVDASSLPVDLLGGARYLHLSGISLAISPSARHAALHAMRTARNLGVQVSFDTNLRLALWSLEQAREGITEALSLTDVALPGLDDVTQLFGPSSPDELVDQILQLGPRLVVLKMGAHGCLVATPDERQLVRPYPVDAKDASGAGDCFDGAFLARLAAGDDPFRAARYANVAAALSTTGFGAVAPIPDGRTVQAALERDPG